MKNNADWIQISGLERTGGTLLNMRMDNNPADTGLFAIPFEYHFSKKYELLPPYEFNKLSKYTRTQLLKICSCTNLSKNDVKRWIRQTFDNDNKKNHITVANAIAKLCWNNSNLKINRYVNHLGRGIYCDWRYLFSSLPNSSIIITIRNPNDFINSTMLLAGFNIDYVHCLKLSYVFSCLMTKLYLREFRDKVHVLSLPDIVEMTEHFHHTMNELNIDVNFEPTMIGKKWLGNSFKVKKLEKTKLTTYKKVFADLTKLQPLYDELDLIKIKNKKIDYLPELSLINEMLGIEYLKESGVAFSNKKIQDMRTVLLYIHMHRRYFYQNYNYSVNNIIQSFPNIKDLLFCTGLILKSAGEKRNLLKSEFYQKYNDAEISWGKKEFVKERVV